MAKKKRKKKVKKGTYTKRFVLCQEVRMGKYIMMDAGAIHKTLPSAKEHAMDCDRSDGEVVIIPMYYPEED
jgi:hypothetical protein